jgi:hypothetical protein
VAAAVRLFQPARAGAAEEIAAAALFLASYHCTFTTGHMLALEGGFMATDVVEGVGRVALNTAWEEGQTAGSEPASASAI